MGINHFVYVDQAWSYNLIGSLKECETITAQLVDDIYQKTASFLMAKHNFYLTKNNMFYNQYMHRLIEHFGNYQLDYNHFGFYFENLFRMLSPSLGQIVEPIVKCTTITSSDGEIEGFVFET